MPRSLAALSGPGISSAARSWADCTINMDGCDLGEAQDIVIGKSPHLRTLEYITGMNRDHIAFQCANAGFSALFQANPFCHVRFPRSMWPRERTLRKRNCIKNEI